MATGRVDVLVHGVGASPPVVVTPPRVQATATINTPVPDTSAPGAFPDVTLFPSLTLFPGP